MPIAIEYLPFIREIFKDRDYVPLSKRELETLLYLKTRGLKQFDHVVDQTVKRGDYMQVYRDSLFSTLLFALQNHIVDRDRILCNRN